MNKALRGRTRDLIAVIILLFAGLGVTLFLISQQKAALPGWVPFFGQDFFELEAEFVPAQAVTPGQGQAIDISGIQVGKVGAVKLENGRAVVRMDIEPKYASLIHPDASLLLRPKSGLADMVIEMDPGTAGREIKENSTVPLANTKPQVNADEILATLDADTRNYLSLLLSGGAQGIGGKEKGLQASAALRRLEPTTRDIAKINTAVAKRSRNLARVIHNFGLLAAELGRHDQQLGRFVDSSNAVFDSFAKQQSAIRASLGELPPTLRATKGALGNADKLALTLRSSLPSLIRSSAVLKPGLEATQRLFRDTTPPIRDQIRPFTRQVRAPVKHLVQGAKPLDQSVSGLKVALASLNFAVNELAYNPNSSVGNYLFYLGWLNHDLNSVYLNQDAYGPLRRGVILASCATATFGDSVAKGSASTVGHPFLRTLQLLTNFPSPPQACD
jgi:phospholipid/cholesterol/gamma-HCH transport system substrate-binding protein